MSYALTLTCDRPGCSARWPTARPPEPGLSFLEADQAAQADGWSIAHDQHLCPSHAARSGARPAPPGCQECGQPIPPGERRTTYCSPQCAFTAQDRKKAERYQAAKAEGTAQGRTGPTKPETAARLARALLNAQL